MEINFVKQRKDAERNSLANSSYMSDLVGFWGNVSEVFSDTNRVTVVSDTGITIPGIPVFSKEWVSADKNKKYITGSRNLPPIGARVFCLAPTHTATGAFVLCSGYAPGDTNKQNLYADKEDKTEIAKKNEIEESVSQGGWHKKEFYKNGNRSFVSADEKIDFQVNLEDDDDESLEKGIKLNLWDNQIIVTENSIKIIDSNGNETEFSKDGFSLTDKNDNSVISDSNGMVLTAKDNKITMNTKGVKIEDKTGNVITGSSSGWDLNGHLTISTPTKKAGV